MSLMVKQMRQDAENPLKQDKACESSIRCRKTSLSVYQGVGGKRLEIGHWTKSQWLQEPNVNEAVHERKVTRETTAALVAGISWGRLVPD